MFSSIQNRQTNSWGARVLTFLAMLFVPYMAFAAPDMSVSSVSGAPGSTVSVSVIADFSQAVNAMQFNLQFDPKLLTVSSVTAGSADNSWIVVNNPNTPGTVIVGMFNTGGSASSVLGSGKQIAVINFTVNNPPGSTATSSTLTLSNAIFDTTSVTQLTAGTFTLTGVSVNYTLTVNIAGNGTVNQNPNSSTYAAGSQVILTATPSTGYQFSSWTGGISSSTNPYTLTMNANTSVTANFSVQTETITASAGSNGTISPSGSVSVNYGTNKTFTVTPNAGYNAALTVDGVAATLTNNAYTFNNVTTNHTIAVNFSLQTETVTASAGAGGTISPSGSVTVNYGANQPFTVTPNAGYTPALMVDGVAVTLTNNAYTLTNVTAAHTVVASFTLQTETITATAGNNGTISPSGSVSVNYGTSKTFTVTPNAGYNAELTVDGSAATLTNNAYTFSNVTANHTIAVSFSLQTETVTASAGTGGTISPSGSVTVNYGANQAFTVTPNAGYTPALTVDGVAVTLTNNAYTLTNVTAAHTVAASFTLQTETITATAGNNGTISPSGSVSVNYGTSKTFTVTPNAGYNAALTVDGAAATLTNNAYTFNNVTANHTIAVSFSLQTETVTASAGAGGTISPSGAVTVNYGVSQLFTVTPNAGYTPTLMVDGSAVTLTNNAYTLTNVTAAHTVAASFTLQAETITATAGNNGTISPSGSVSVNYGINKTFTVTPNAGYNAALTVDGVAATLTNNAYTFNNVTTNHTIAVSFSLQTETVTASAGAGGTISPSGAVTVNYGANQPFTVTPNAGYTPALTVDGVAVTLTNNAYTLTNVTAAHTVAASFTLQTETITASAGANGSISPSGSVIVNYGTNKTFTVTPNAGYNAALIVDGVAATLTNNAYTFSNVTTNHSIAVSFSLIPPVTYTITASAGSNGSISPSGSVSVNSGASKTFTVTPAAGYSATLTVDGAAATLTNNAYTFNNVTANHSIAVSFSLIPPVTYTITASAGSNGSISPSGSVSVNSGASKTFTVAPAAGYSATLTVDGAAATLTNNAYTFNNVTTNHTIVVSFSLIPPVTYTITASAGSNGSISPSGSVSVNSGASKTFTVTPAAGYSATLTVDGSAATLTNNAYAFSNVTTNHSIAVSFSLIPPVTYTITASAGNNGSISPSGSVSVNSGASKTFTVAPAAGYSATLTVDGAAATLTNNAYTFSNVTTNHTIAAIFSIKVIGRPIKKPTETITVSAGPHGTISPSGSVKVNYGASQTFTVTPAAGYTAKLTVDGAVVTITNNTYTLSNVIAAHTVAASFSAPTTVPITETITVSAGPNGTISPSGSVIVKYGASQTFTVTPNARYTPTLTVDGVTVTLTNNTYTLSKVTSAHTVVASFTLGHRWGWNWLFGR